MGVGFLLLILFFVVFLPFQYRNYYQSVRHDYEEWKNNRR